MAADKDYSATPLAQKLGAKPGAGVVAFFTTSGADLEGRFLALKEMLDPADGLWIAWPKKAAKIDSDLTLEAVQEIGLAHGLVDNKSCAIDESWQALRFVYRLRERWPTPKVPRNPYPTLTAESVRFRRRRYLPW